MYKLLIDPASEYYLILDPNDVLFLKINKKNNINTIIKQFNITNIIYI